MIRTVPETGSTNADLLARLAAGEHVPEGEWLVADRQVAGRGRRGREWFDGSGNFMGSTVVHPAQADPPRATLALLAGLALHETVGALLAVTSKLFLKWPNDLLLGGAKLAGILLEGEGDSVVIGIGVNLAAAPQLPDRQTVALSELGPAPDRDHFAASLAKQFDSELERWRTYGLNLLLRRWRAAAHPEGTTLLAEEPGGNRIEGTFAGLDGTGSLLLRLEDGTIRAIHAGDVMLA